jgi:hypothetical protein
MAVTLRVRHGPGRGWFSGGVADLTPPPAVLAGQGDRRNITTAGTATWHPASVSSRRRAPGSRVSRAAILLVAVFVGFHELAGLAPVQALLGTAAGERGAGSGPSYTFLQTQPGYPGSPVTYDPCRPIDVLANDDLAPLGADRMLTDAIHQVAAASGFRIRLVGHTHALPSTDTWALALSPVIVAWADSDSIPTLGGDPIGRGGSVTLRTVAGVRSYYATGHVWLDTPALKSVLERPDGEAQVTAVMMHELGHVLGLGHTTDRSQVMYKSTGQLTLGAGDRAGLRILGNQPCRP